MFFYSKVITDSFDQIIRLVSYYSDSDMPTSVRMDCNKLTGIIAKIELIKGQMKPIQLPYHYECELNRDRGSSIRIDSFTFTPTFNISNNSTLSDKWSELDEIKKELQELDIAGMLAYVREKAVAAGDLAATLED